MIKLDEQECKMYYIVLEARQVIMIDIFPDRFAEKKCL